MWLVERTRDMMDDGTDRDALFVTENATYAQDFVAAANIETEAAATITAPYWKPRETGVEFNARQTAHIDTLKTIMKLDTWLQDDQYLDCGNYGYVAREVEVR